MRVPVRPSSLFSSLPELPGNCHVPTASSRNRKPQIRDPHGTQLLAKAAFALQVHARRAAGAQGLMVSGFTLEFIFGIAAADAWFHPVSEGLRNKVKQLLTWGTEEVRGPKTHSLHRVSGFRGSWMQMWCRGSWSRLSSPKLEEGRACDWIG